MVQVPFLDRRFYTRLLVAPPGGADFSWMVGFVVATGAEQSARQELPATAGPLGAAPIEVS